jgi:hypothetical protein
MIRDDGERQAGHNPERSVRIRGASRAERKETTAMAIITPTDVPATPAPAGDEGDTRSTSTTPAVSSVPWVLDLKTGQSWSSAPVPAITFKNTPHPVAGGWQAACVRIDLGREFKQANIVVEYEGAPEGYTLNVGDSPTNDAYGGDSGSGACAELQVIGQTMRVWGKPYTPQPAYHVFATSNLVLQDGSLKVVVRDKFVSVGQPYFPMQDPDLFQLPDASSKDGSAIYAAFNSVVTQRADRVGKGLRRVMITLQ